MEIHQLTSERILAPLVYESSEDTEASLLNEKISALFSETVVNEIIETEFDAVEPEEREEEAAREEESTSPSDEDPSLHCATS